MHADSGGMRFLVALQRPWHTGLLITDVPVHERCRCNQVCLNLECGKNL